VRVYTYEDLEKRKTPFNLMLEDAEKIRQARVGPLNFGVLSRYVITLPRPGEVYRPPEVVTIPEIPPPPPPPPPPVEVWEKVEVEVTRPEVGLVGLVFLLMMLMMR
jgi:hypothetical protein